MTKIAFPIHYTFMAVYQKYRSKYPLFVTETAEFDIREIEDSEAPVVASVETKWKLPIRGMDHSQPRAKTEEFGVRTFEDRFYVPVRQYRKSDPSKWSTVTTENFPDIHFKQNFATSPFELPVPKTPTYATNPTVGFKSATSHDGGHNDYDTFKVREISNPEVRDQAMTEAKKLMERFVLINGELWLATKSEPVIKYDRKTGGNIFIDIIETRELGPEDEGFFRLNRLDECKDFIASAYPDVDIMTHIKSIKINEPDAFKFADDTTTLKAMAEGVNLRLREFAGYDTSNTELQSYSSKMNEAYADLESGLDNGDTVAELMAKIARKFTGQYKLNATAMKAMVERWNMRPVEASFRMGR